VLPVDRTSDARYRPWWMPAIIPESKDPFKEFADNCYLSTAREETVIQCRDCKRKTAHLVLADVVHNIPDDDEEDTWEASESYQIVQCRGCRTFTFRRQQTADKDMRTRDPDRSAEAQNVIVQELFPVRESKRDGLLDSEHVPDYVWKPYDETRTAMASNLPILAGIGIRAILDAICRQQKTKPGLLGQRLNELTARGVLTRTDEDLLQRTKGIGNQAAHEATVIAPDVLQAAFDVVEHLLKTLYVIPKIGKTIPKEKPFKKRKKKAPVKSAPKPP